MIPPDHNFGIQNPQNIRMLRNNFEVATFIWLICVSESLDLICIDFTCDLLNLSDIWFLGLDSNEPLAYELFAIHINTWYLNILFLLTKTSDIQFHILRIAFFQCKGVVIRFFELDQQWMTGETLDQSGGVREDGEFLFTWVAQSAKNIQSTQWVNLYLPYSKDLGFVNIIMAE